MRAMLRRRDANALQSTRIPAPPITIRRATRDDLDALVALDARITGWPKPGYWQDIFERYGTRRLEERFLLIAELQSGPDAGRVVGHVTGEIRAWEFGSEPCGWIFGFAVDPEFRLGRIGERLFDDITGRMRATGSSISRELPFEPPRS